MKLIIINLKAILHEEVGDIVSPKKAFDLMYIMEQLLLSILHDTNIALHIVPLI